jgi:hypothetical protein
MMNKKTILGCMVLLISGCFVAEPTCNDAPELVTECTYAVCTAQDGLWCRCALQGYEVEGCACGGSVYYASVDACEEMGVDEYLRLFDCDTMTSWMIERTATVCEE